ncbi:MAG: hypothetical protein AAFW69_06695, partial [Pseudomonadota bacterium]
MIETARLSLRRPVLADFEAFAVFYGSDRPSFIGREKAPGHGHVPPPADEGGAVGVVERREGLEVFEDGAAEGEARGLDHAIASRAGW